MHGYGEFYWKNGKIYAGYYVHDKKEGFGVYYWENPYKAYIGFWLDGKQDGVGKYLTPNKERYGLWKEGKIVKWFKTDEEALSYLREGEEHLAKMFRCNLEDITLFLKS